MANILTDGDLLSVICELREIQALRTTVAKSLKSAAIVGTSVGVGALLLGPIGIAIGGIVSSLGTAIAEQGEFRSVPDILMNDLTPQQKQRLLNSIRSLFFRNGIRNISQLSFAGGAVISQVVNIVKSFIENEFSLTVK